MAQLGHYICPISGTLKSERAQLGHFRSHIYNFQLNRLRNEFRGGLGVKWVQMGQTKKLGHLGHFMSPIRDTEIPVPDS